MSDIGAVGVGSWLGALATIALGLVGAFLCLVVGLASRRRDGSSAVAAYCAGPLACFAIGCVSFALVEEVFLDLSDRWGAVWLGAGIGAWIAVAMGFRSRARRG